MKMKVKTIKTVAVCAVCALAVSAGAVEIGDDLILNGRMNADQMDMPPYWAADAATACRLELSSGPEGLPALTFLPSSARVNAVRQNGLNLASNGVYVLSFMYKADNAKFGVSSIGIAAAGWTLYSGMNLPPQTDGWQRFTRKVKARYSPRDGNRHFLVFYTKRQTAGTVSFADISLKPADAASAEGADFSDGAKSQREIRLVPVRPFLNEISRKDRTVDFRFFGALPPGVPESGCEVRVVARGCGPVTVPLSRDAVKVKFPESATGGVFTASVVSKTGGEPLFTREYDYALTPALSYPVRGKKLNNLCSELLREPVKTGRRIFRFGVRRRTWHFFSAPGDAVLNGKKLFGKDSARREAFRELEPGDYGLEINAASEGDVIVRRIAEIFNYCPCHPAAVPQPLPYDWEFQRRYVLPSVTTQCGGYPKRAELEEMREAGYRVIHNQGGRNLKDDDDFLARLRKSTGMNDPFRGGVSADELFLHESVNNSRYMKSVWRATASGFPGKGVYTWMVGAPAAAGLDHDFISSAVNSCGGRSRILYEMYMPSQSTEARAAEYITSRMRSTVAAYKAFIPDVAGRFGVIFGNFNQMPAITLWNHPEIDYKYHLDMQWHTLATDPAFAGIGVCGYWGSYYTDEEMHRWSFMLTRHYVVEGRTDMLSPSYGLRYTGLVPDGDFRKGQGGWAFSGGMKTASHPKISGWRGIAWRDSDEGDRYAAMPAREEGGISRMSRKITGLVPGRLYTLRCCSFDIGKIEKTDKIRESTGITVDVGPGGKKIDRLSWHNDGRTTTGYDKKRPGINVTHIVFEAVASDTEIGIANSGTPAGRRIGVNAVSVVPYVPADASARNAVR